VRLVTLPIPRLLRRRAVISEAVGLDDEPEFRPVEIDLEAVHAASGPGLGKAGSTSDRQEPALELGVGERERWAIEQLSQRRNSVPAGQPTECRAESLRIDESQLVRFVDRDLQLTSCQPGGEVDQRADGLCNGDAVAAGDGVRSKVGATVNKYAGNPVPLRRRNRDLQLASGLHKENPQRAGGSVT
jgi:hypothetical protein